jgi:hypothetical protein
LAILRPATSLFYLVKDENVCNSGIPHRPFCKAFAKPRPDRAAPGSLQTSSAPKYVDTNPPPVMVLEDFSFMLIEMPGCYVNIGNGSVGDKGGVGRWRKGLDQRRRRAGSEASGDGPIDFVSNGERAFLERLSRAAPEPLL